MSAGVLLVVGLGYRSGAQTTPEAESALRDAGTVLYLTSDPVTSIRLREVNASARSLHDSYREGVHGAVAAEEMVGRIVDQVREGGGETVCVALDGHPAVYSNIALEAMRRVRAAGHEADMLPAISAVDCLYAAAGMDPGKAGCQLFEASDFVSRRRAIDTNTPLVLLQVGVVGVTAYQSRREGDRAGLSALSLRLAELYGTEHELLLYEMSSLPWREPRLERIVIAKFPDAGVSVNATLYVPPLASPRVDADRMRRLGLALRDGRLEVA